MISSNTTASSLTIRMITIRISINHDDHEQERMRIIMINNLSMMIIIIIDGVMEL